ncbi:MAG: acetamidase/formamidase family protein, partial [Acidobacteriaceae bacterium]|nr:acetamidase/formamidase family protein [Acidobacteriaceae bacterium]
VCINGIECPANVTLRFHVHKHHFLHGPLIQSTDSKLPDVPADSWIVVESGSDPAAAARAATSRIVDLLADHWDFAPEHAYILCSVAMKLRLSQVVNEPIFTVSAAMPRQILPERNLF